MIYIDLPKQHRQGSARRWSHLWSSSHNLEELHAFAAKIGLQREWFQDRPDTGRGPFPHYDLYSGRLRARAMAAGAVVTPLRAWLRAGGPQGELLR